MSRVSELRALAEKATPGPWEWHHYEKGRGSDVQRDSFLMAPKDSSRSVVALLHEYAPRRQDGTLDRSGMLTDADAAFIAEWRNAAPALLAVVEAAIADHRPDLKHDSHRAECEICLALATLESGA